MKFYDNNPQREYQEKWPSRTGNDEIYKLVLHNDDVNTFDFRDRVFNRKVCKHTQLEQKLEQCTILVHYKGKCAKKQVVWNF